jgi:crotonobetainyl-CoA:carnitine CoA-transferase CaiB-like acyl-CoA transferase
VIAATTEAEWRGLCEVTGHLEWLRDERYITNQARLANLDTLDAAIAGWTRQQTPHQVMYLLQHAGVPAAVVANGEDLFLDPHLRARGFMLETEHEDGIIVAHSGPPIRLSGSTVTLRRPSPGMGADNDYVFRDLLSLDPALLGVATR